MNVVGYGGGTDSTAMLIGLWKHHIPVDLILFADPGGEQPHTYVYLEIMDRWLKSHDMPPITRVWYQEKSGQRLTLEQECLRSGTLPSIAYGRKSCSLKGGPTGAVLQPIPALPGYLGKGRKGGQIYWV